jgi:radical SAM superfamily enzyme YgiQ (UPF0313 family)
MKVCLISAPTANEFTARAVGEKEAARIIGELAPVGILSLAAVLEAHGLQPEVVELNRLYYQWLQSSADDHGRTANDFCRFCSAWFAERHFDFYGLSTVCSSYPLTLRLAAELKRLHPESVVALGGPQASVVDVASLHAYSFIDVVVRGEAEHSLPGLLDALASHSSLDSVSGITFRRGGEVLRTPDAPLILDLDSIPFPAFHLYPDMGFCRHFPLELGRGCPFSCTFCSTNDFFRRRFRLKSPERMIADMRRVKESYGIDSFELVHDMFTVDRKRVVAFCEALVACNEKFYWGCSARTDCIDHELIALLHRAGCRGIFFGIESGSPRMQTIIDKCLDLKIAAEQVRLCDQQQIKTAVSLITGFPEETMADVRDTVAFFMDSLRFDYADPQLQILAPLAGTPIEAKHRDELILDDSVADMSYRGWPQTAEDHKMIAEHAEVFSNFYSVPAPGMQREFLKELRDFLLNGMRLFRWLLIGLHAHGGNIADVFQQWQSWRADKHLSFPDNDRAAYYSHGAFAGDFIEFVRSCYIPTSSRTPIAIAALAEYESALLSVRRQTATANGRSSSAADAGAVMSAHSRPHLHPAVRVIQLCGDYQEIVRRLRKQQPLDELQAKPVTVVITPIAVLQLSPVSAELLRLCEGGNTIKQIAAEFSLKGIQVQGVPVDQACMAGIELLRRQQILTLA